MRTNPRTLTEKEWSGLAKLTGKAADAVEELETQLLLAECNHDLDSTTIKVLGDLRKKVTDLGLRSMAYFMTPQPEWTGGDSMDPKNFKVREPHCMPKPARYIDKG